MREVATTLTDFLLALLAGIAMVRLLRSPGVAVSLGAPVFFGGFAAAAVWGGVWHGWFSADTSLMQQVIWWLSMLSAAVAAAGLALLGIELFGVHNRGSAKLLLIALAIFAVVAWHDPRFLLVVLVTACGTLICCAGLLLHAWRVHPRAAGVALIGLAGSVLAGIAQQSGFALRPPAFDHNATYHVLLIPALSLFYAGLTRLFGDSPRSIADADDDRIDL